VEQLRRRRYNLRYHKTLEKGVKEKKTRGNLGTGKGGGSSSTNKRNISKIWHLDIEPQTKLVGKEIGIAEQNVDIDSLVSL
jgi:hypothetical protein